MMRLSQTRTRWKNWRHRCRMTTRHPASSSTSTVMRGLRGSWARAIALHCQASQAPPSSSLALLGVAVCHGPERGSTYPTPEELTAQSLALPTRGLTADEIRRKATVFGWGAMSVLATVL